MLNQAQRSTCFTRSWASSRWLKRNDNAFTSNWNCSIPFWYPDCSHSCVKIPHPTFWEQFVLGFYSTHQNQSDNRTNVRGGFKINTFLSYEALGRHISLFPDPSARIIHEQWCPADHENSFNPIPRPAQQNNQNPNSHSNCALLQQTLPWKTTQDTCLKTSLTRERQVEDFWVPAGR